MRGARDRGRGPLGWRLAAGVARLIPPAPGRSGRSRAELATAFAASEQAERSRLAHLARREVSAASLAAGALLRLDPVAACARLTLSGWDHLLAAEAEGHGVLLLTAPLGRWEPALRAVRLYRGEAAFAALPGPEPGGSRRALRRRSRRCELARLDGDELVRHVAGGGRAALLIRLGGSTGPGAAGELLGRRVAPPPPLAALAPLAAPWVPIFGLPDGAARFRVEIHPALDREGEPAERVRRWVDLLDREVRRHPLAWPWGRGW